MSECICSDCGKLVFTRSEFELECPECGGELVEQDAYDPEPRELVCVDCSLKVHGGGTAQSGDDEFYEGSFSVDDPCPRCGGILDPDVSKSKKRQQPEFKVAKGAARQLMKKHDLSCPGIDVEKLAIAEGLLIVKDRYDHEGRLSANTIEVPIDESREAQRFLIAHELGHWILRHEYQISGSKIEPEANAFASELLITEADLREAVKGSRTLADLRKHFGVSREAMVYALMSARLMSRVRSK